jgi:hypothetical protein
VIVNALEEFNALLARSGVSLAPLGTREIGLPRSDALRAVELLRQAKCLVLGGDVYLRRGDRLVFAYAMWSIDYPKPDENRETYLHRSWDTADSYIKSFPEQADAEALFVIVFKADPE